MVLNLLATETTSLPTKRKPRSSMKSVFEFIYLCVITNMVQNKYTYMFKHVWDQQKALFVREIFFLLLFYF
jgi:hypothetical protein